QAEFRGAVDDKLSGAGAGGGVVDAHGDTAAGAGDAPQFAQGLIGVGDVVEHVAGGDGVELVVGERQGLGVAEDAFDAGDGVGGGDHGGGVVQSDEAAAVAMVGEVGREPAVAAADMSQVLAAGQGERGQDPGDRVVGVFAVAGVGVDADLQRVDGGVFRGQAGFGGAHALVSS